jgi:chromosome segregation ATPase
MTAETHAAALRFTLEATEADLEAQRSSITQILAEKESINAELQTQRLLTNTVEEQEKAHLDKISELEENIDVLKTANHTMLEALTNAKSKSRSVSEKLQDAESSNKSLLNQLSVAMDEKSTLGATLEISETSVVSLASQAVSLKSALSHEKATVLDLSAAVVALQEKVATTSRLVSALETDLNVSRNSVEELRAQLVTVTDERETLASQLAEVQSVAANSAASLVECESTLARATQNLREAKEAATKMQVTLDTTTAELEGEKVNNQKMGEVLTTKESELRDTAQNLAMTESMAGKFREESKANKLAASDLRAQLLEAQEQATATTELLSAVEASHAEQFKTHRSAISDIENLLQTARTEVEDLKSELQQALAAHAGLQSTLEDQGADLTLARGQLEAERTRTLGLESEVAVAVGKVQEVEDELAELKVSKETDEETIQSLKEMFAKLRENQMRSLVELDNQV